MEFAQDYPKGFLKSLGMERTAVDSERRRNCRKPLELSIYCHKVGTQDARLLSGSTVNVSPGGALVQMRGGGLRDGELVSVEMAIPAGQGLLENRGAFSSYARVVRVDDAHHAIGSRKRIALEFCESPRFRF